MKTYLRADNIEIAGGDRVDIEAGATFVTISGRTGKVESLLPLLDDVGDFQSLLVLPVQKRKGSGIDSIRTSDIASVSQIKRMKITLSPEPRVFIPPFGSMDFTDHED